MGSCRDTKMICERCRKRIAAAVLCITISPPSSSPSIANANVLPPSPTSTSRCSSKMALVADIRSTSYSLPVLTRILSEHTVRRVLTRLTACSWRHINDDHLQTAKPANGWTFCNLGKLLLVVARDRTKTATASADSSAMAAARLPLVHLSRPAPAYSSYSNPAQPIWNTVFGGNSVVPRPHVHGHEKKYESC